MASYDAQINILVAGQRNIQNLANQLNGIENSIGEIERRWRSASGALQRSNIRLGVTGTQQPRGEGGRFTRDPDRQARFAAFADQRRARIDQQMSRLALGRTRAEAVRARGQIEDNRTLLSQTERRIILESRLNSANELFQRKVQQFSRGGSGRALPNELQTQARGIQSAYEAAGGAASRNVRLIQALATEMGRVVERQNEFNRLQSLGSKGFEAGRRLQERITVAASRADLPRSRVTNARTLATEVIATSRGGDQQAYSEAVRRATAATARLERESKELADALNGQEREIARIAKLAPRSPVGGGINFPGSPKALEAQRRAQEIALRQAQQGFQSSPILGTATMLGSPKWLAAQKRAQSAAEKEARSGYPSSPIKGGVNMPGSPIYRETPFLERQFGKRGGSAISEGLVGGAFPLLFGQGAGASLGGLVGGAAGGFAGGGLGFGLSLIGTALGTTFDTFVQSAKDLASALERPVENFDELKTAAFFSSKELERSIQRLIDFGDKASASAAIQEEAIKKIGVNGVKNLAYLGSEADRLNRAWNELGQQMQALIAGPLASFISTINQVVGPMVQAGRVEALRGSLSGAQQQELDTELNRAAARGTYKPTGKMSSTAVEVLARFEPEKVQAILDKWQPIVVKGKIKITEKERLESEINALQKQLEVIEIAKGITAQVRQAAREQEDLDRQRNDLVRSYEESIASIRQRVEDEIASKRFATLQKENELFDLQGQIRLKSLEISNRSAIAQAGTGQRPEVEQAAKEVAGIVADFTQQQLEAEEEAAKIKRDAALDAQKIDFEGAKFKADIEKEVSRLNIETARKVSDINLQVARKNEEYDDRRFEIEKKIGDLKLLQMQNELSLITRDVSASELTRRLANQTFGELTVVRRQLAEQQPPARLRGVGAVGGGGVSTSGLDKATAGYKTAIQNFVNAQLELNRLTATSSSEDFTNRIDAFVQQVEAPLKQNIQSAIDADEERLAYARAINEGMTEAQARRALEIQQAVTLADLTYEAAIAELERRKAMKGTTDAMREQIDIAIERLEITREKSRDQMSGLVDTAVESERGKQIFDFIIQTKAQLNDLESYAVRVSQGIGDAIGNSLSTGIAGLIEGTTAAKEVFGNFLKDMGMMLIEEGTKMIAMYIAIGVAKLFAGFSGGSTGGAGATPGVNVNPAGTGIQTIPVVGMPAANGAYFDGATAYFAKGGIVGSPTLFQFADGGTMQTGLMGEAGPEAIMPLRRTPDGRLGVEAIPFQGGSEEASADAAIPFQSQSGGTTVNNFQQLQSAKIPFTKSTEQLVSESRERETVSAINNPKPLDVRFESQVINGVEYVTAEQHQRGMAQAAERGRALTLASLQNSVKTRKQVGMS